MTSIRVQERTSVDDVLAWQLASCEMIRMSRRSGFEPGAQGLALSSLAALRPGHQAPVLECEFEEPTNIAELESTLLGSAFGFALARLTSRIQFAGRAATVRFKPLLGELYKTRNGVLGAGSSRSIVCPDPVFPLPPALAQAGTVPPPEFFPAPSAFTALLNSIVEAMGFRRLLASTEESSIVSFVYEALRNSWEHGLSVDASRRARSTRALIVEKVVLQGSTLTNRHLSDELKQYLERIVEANRRELGLGVICLTVSDQGDGIQATLPCKENLAEETPAQRLARAFLPGESRKPTGVVMRGLGLPSVVSAAHNLQALMRITSGNLIVGQDFSVGEDKYPRLNFDTMRQLPDDFVCGTCVSIFVPEFAFDLDQRSLFPS
jgi:hypothetical protein